MDYEFSLIKPSSHSKTRLYAGKRSAIMDKIYQSCLLMSKPGIMNDITYMDVPGREIILPLSSEEIQLMNDDFVERFWNKTKKRYRIENQYLFQGFPSRITKRFQMNHEFSHLFHYILFPRIMVRLLQENSINLKDVRLVILDSDNRKIELILEVLYQELNYLKIITERQEYFQEFKEMIYCVTGLVAETSGRSEKDLKEANMIIDLNPGVEYDYRLFARNAIVFDMESTQEKRQYFAAKRKDLKILYGCDLLYHGELIDNSLAGMIYYGRNQIIREFVEDKKRDYMTKELIEIGKELNIFKLKYLNFS